MSARLKQALSGGKLPLTVANSHVCALYVPVNVHVGNTFQDMANTTDPVVDAYSKVLQVFLAMCLKVPQNCIGSLFFETIVTPDKQELGTRYILVLDGPNVASEVDSIAEKEIICHWDSVSENKGVSRKNYKKSFGSTFGSQWKTFFNGVSDWHTSVFAVFPDVEPRDAESFLASKVLNFEESFTFSGACEEQQSANNYYDDNGAFVFPQRDFARHVCCDLTRPGILKYGSVIVRELSATRISASTIINLSAQFAPQPAALGDDNARAAPPPPLNRPFVQVASAPGRWHAPLVRPTTDFHRFLPLASLAQAIKVINVAVHKVEDPKARYILSSFCNLQMGDAFLHALRTSDQRSPGDIAMMDYATQTVDGIPTTSCYWNSRWLPVYEAMSVNEALISKCIAALEIYYSVDMCHHEALMLLLGAADCFRVAFETMKFCAWIYSKGGGVSKSFMLNLVKTISVKGMIKMIGRFTAAAFAINGTEENPKCPNQTMQLIGIDDTDPDLFSESPRDTKQQAALKGVMTGQVAAVNTMGFDDDGNRIGKFIEAPHSGVFIILSNVARIESQSLERRAQTVAASEVSSSTIDKAVIESWEFGLDGQQRSFSTEFRWLQYCQYMISQLQYAGLLPEFTYGAAGVILLELSKELKKDPDIKAFTRIDTSVLQRIKSYARLLEINKICLQAFCSVRGEYRAIGVADFLKLAPRMYISVESICNSAMFLLEGWLPSMRFVVADAVEHFIASKVESSAGLAKNPVEIVNQTHLRFPISEVANFVVAKAPSMTRDFTPNYATVVSHLRTFLSLKPEDSFYYRPSPDLSGKVVRENSSTTVKVRPFVETPARFGSSNFDIAISHYAHILATSSTDFFVLSNRLVDDGFDMNASEASKVKVFSENAMRHMRCDDTPCNPCMSRKEETGAADMTASLFNFLNLALQDQEDLPYEEAMLSHAERKQALERHRKIFIQSFLWSPSLPTADSDGVDFTTRQMVQQLVENRNGLVESRFIAHFKGKMRAYLNSSFSVNLSTKRWEPRMDAPSIQWIRNAQSGVTTVKSREASIFCSTSYDKVAKILKAFLNGKNQLPRRIFAGPHPELKDRVQYVEVGGCSVYDATKHVTITLKNRNCKMLGKVDLDELAKVVGDLKRVDIKVNYDLDIWTQERHFEATGIDPSVVCSVRLFDDLANLLKTSSPEFDDRFINGVPAKDLAPVMFNEIPAIAGAIKERIRQEPAQGEDDIFFPQKEVDRKVAIAISQRIPPEVFKLQDYYTGNNKTMCFASVWQQDEEEMEDID